MGSIIYLRWDPPYGWCVGRIERMYTKDTPRLFKKYNYEIEWAAETRKKVSSDHMLSLDTYLGKTLGETAPAGSWQLLAA